MSYQRTPSTAPVRKIKRVQFGILSPEEIVAHSTAKIEHAEVYERGQPKSGGLADVRLGCMEKNMKCYTCSENMNNCQVVSVTLNSNGLCITWASSKP
ncbi:DNA-directed RNA polymerase [Powellomyces hirtus]|uniref:DNA-directed RNA polymerase n=1 Tax=Powellomyces hirtus TaxID=109895 RepID=A0A507E4N5_9FUNG|nr:DNA-directed RNA polymerase [Powellomyces hirtus]